MKPVLKKRNTLWRTIRFSKCMRLSYLVKMIVLMTNHMVSLCMLLFCNRFGIWQSFWNFVFIWSHVKYISILPLMIIIYSSGTILYHFYNMTTLALVIIGVLPLFWARDTLYMTPCEYNFSRIFAQKLVYICHHV